MKKPVGQGASNHAADVKYVQYLLADWQIRTKAVPLVVDGKCGPHTVSAIRSFQKANTRVTDGRVDVAGPTIRSLEHTHLTNTLSSVRCLDTLSLRSGARPATYQLQLQPAADRYLADLRARFS